MRLAYGQWTPDQPPFLSKGLRGAVNTYAAAIGYRPVGQFAPLASALAEKPIAAAAFVGGSAVGAVVAGSAHTLYRFTGAGWTTLGSGYSAITWRFARFGNIVIATNGVDPMQKFLYTGGAASALGGTPPTAELLAVVKDFVLAGVINGNRAMVRWSAINNAEEWTIGLDQSDYQILPTGGDVTGLFGGEFGIVLQRGRISRMSYDGGNIVFQFDEISNNIGCVSANSVAQAGTFGFFLSDTGFMMWDGQSLKPIGAERVDRTFASLYSHADLVNMSAAVDLKNRLVVWTMPERTFVYNWAVDRWSLIEQPATLSFAGDNGGDPVFYMIDNTYRIGAFTGGPMEARFETGSLELVPGREARLASVRPLTDAEDGVTLSFARQARLSDTPNLTDYTEMTPSGDMPVRESGRYLKITQTMAAETNWTYVEGLDLVPRAGARR